ncbi:MAG: thiamine ABC transporter substrate-binding protein [Pleomorphochaeta sp.]|jgi:thiamine transport system substrate-binding protein
MKKFFTIVVALIATTSTLFAAGAKETSDTAVSNEITVYAYDAFCGDWGPGQKVVEAFKEKTGIDVNLVSAGDAIEMLTKAELEKDNPKADVIIGISDDMAVKAYNSDLFDSYDSPVLNDIPEFLQFDKQNRLLPFDYGNFAFVYDSEKISQADLPKSLEDLTDPKYKDKVLLIDPRTSSVGLGLLIWTRELFGDDYLNWWENMKDNALTITEGWSSAYGMFTAGEAPITLSYTTSPVYHVMFEDTTRYQALIFDEGHSATIEGVGILKSSNKKDLAKQFVDFLLTDAQLDIASANSMYPTNLATELPKAFDWAPKPQITLSLDANDIEDNLDTWLNEWTEVMSK